MLVTSNYPANWGKQSLLSDLIESLGNRGHFVEILSINYSGEANRGNYQYSEQIRIRNVGGFKLHLGKFGKPLNWILGILEAWVLLHIRRNEFLSDLCIFTSIGISNLWLPKSIKRLKVSKKTLFILWDFFPIHQMEIGHWNFGPFSSALKFIEGKIIASADAISLMSAENKIFLDRYHGTLRSKRYILLPPWSSSGISNVSNRQREKYKTFTVLFGGQLTSGRGIINLLRSFEILNRDGHKIDLIVAGDGPDREELEKITIDSNITNVKFLGQLERTNFRDLAGKCHLGVAITDSRVSPPSFPSKIPEYLGLGLPVVAGLEASSDAMDLLISSGVGSVCSPDNPSEIADSILFWSQRYSKSEINNIRHNSLLLYQKEYSVEIASNKIELYCQSL